MFDIGILNILFAMLFLVTTECSQKAARSHTIDVGELGTPIFPCVRVGVFKVFVDLLFVTYCGLSRLGIR